MPAIQELRKEHKAIEVMLRVLEAVSAKIRRGEPVAVTDLAAMVEFLSIFADQCHHGKEEDLLFPTLEGAGIPRQGGPIGVMLSEHTQGRALIARLREAVAQLKSGNEAASASFASAADDYVALLRRHIDKENNVLFAMAEARLSAVQDAELSRAFEQLELDRIGAGKHEQFHALLDRLQQQYLTSSH
jgi:hemerythrin-like domain-containing protein